MQGGTLHTLRQRQACGFVFAPIHYALLPSGGFFLVKSEQPRSHGCLFSILGALALVVLLGAGAFFYGSWFFQGGFRTDPALQNAMAQVRVNRTAHDVLGSGIVVESMESEIFSATTGKGKTVTYALHVKGDKGEGELHIML